MLQVAEAVEGALDTRFESKCLSRKHFADASRAAELRRQQGSASRTGHHAFHAGILPHTPSLRRD